MRGSRRSRIGAVAGAVAVSLGALLGGSALRPAPVSAAYCDDYPFLCATLTVAPTGNGSGTVTTADGFINCRYANGARTGTCSKRYIKDQAGNVTVQMTGTPDAGDYGCYGSGCSASAYTPPAITFSSDRLDSGWSFAPQDCTTVPDSWCITFGFALSGNGTAAIDSTDGFLHCSRSGGATSGTCTHDYWIGPVKPSLSVTWFFAPAAGSIICDTSSNCGADSAAISPGDDMTISYVVSLVDYTISVLPNGGLGYGTITSDVGGINCGQICYATYHYGDKVRLTATPNATSQFSSWNGPCAGQDATCDFTVVGDQFIAAAFAKAGSSAPPGATPHPAETTTPRASTGATQPPGSSASAAPPGTVLASLDPGTSPVPAASDGGVAGSANPPASAEPGSGEAVDEKAPDLTLLALAILGGAVIIAIGLVVGLRGRRPPRDAGSSPG